MRDRKLVCFLACRLRRLHQCRRWCFFARISIRRMLPNILHYVIPYGLEHTKFFRASKPQHLLIVYSVCIRANQSNLSHQKLQRIYAVRESLSLASFSLIPFALPELLCRFSSVAIAVVSNFPSYNCSSKNLPTRIINSTLFRAASFVIPCNAGSKIVRDAAGKWSFCNRF